MRMHPRAWANGIVELMADGETKKKDNVQLQLFQNKSYKQYQSTDAPTVVLDWMKHCPSKHFDSQVACVKAAWMLDLQKVLADNEHTWAWLQIQTKPKRAVIATDDHDKHDLMLVAASPSVSHVTDVKKIPEAAVRLGTKKICGVDVYFYVTGYCSVPETRKEVGNNDWMKNFCAPYWLVQPTEHANKANMELINKPGCVGTLPVPMMRNCKAVPSKHEFLIFKAKKSSKKDDAAAAAAEAKKNKKDDASAAAAGSDAKKARVS